MDENNMMNNENEELNEVQETVEETEEAVVEATDEVEESEAEEVYAEEVYEDEMPVEEFVEPKEVNYKLLSVIGFALAAVILVVSIALSVNTYNRKYVSVSNYTIAEVADSLGMKLSAFKKEYGLPLLMKKNTYAESAMNVIKVGKIAEINETDFETLKNAYEFGDKVTAKTAWGKAIDTVKLSKYLEIEMKEYKGEEGLAEFKKEYELGDEVTGDTLWGDVKETVLSKQKKNAVKEIANTFAMVKGYNKYNNMGYLDTTGGTIADVVAATGGTLSKFLEEYGLPADMPGDTYINAAQSLIPLKKMAEMSGMTFEDVKTRYNFGDEITEDTTWGVAVDSLTLRDYVGEANFEMFKTEYELGDEITLDTKWGEIRKQLEEKQVAERVAQEKAMESAQTETEAPVEESAEEPAEEAPAEETAE